MTNDIDEQFKEFEQKLFDTIMERNPILATHMGIHDYDDILPDISEKKHLDDIELLEKNLEELEQFNNEDLSVENVIAKKLGIHIINLLLYEMKELSQWRKNPSLPNAVGSAIFPLIRRDFAPFEDRLESIIGRIEDIPRLVEEEKTKLTDPIELWIDMAIESAEQLPMLMKLVLSISQQNSVDQDQIEKLNMVVNEADEALDKYIDWLEDKKKDATNDFAIGEEKFEELLKRRELEYNSNEILELGEKLLKESQDAVKRYANEIDPELDVDKVIENVMSETPDDFEKALSWYREGLEDAKNFVLENNLATIPDNEEIEVTETPEYLRPIIPFAAYMGPAKFDPVKKGIYMVTPPNNENDLSNYSYWDVRNTTVHEGYPGHHLQLACAATNDDVFHLFSHAVETIEGWAHYTEEMMKEQGFDDTPEARLIQSRDIVWRAARIIVDVKLSRKEMSFDEAVEFLVETVKMKKEDAIAEIKRYTQNPAYQLSYLLGKYMLKELKEEVKEKMGDKFTEKFFHDTILYSGSIPIKYIREIFDKKM
ncbi:MAG: DUF885 domain-containing protein [Thermoplasmatota archaeon]